MDLVSRAQRCHLRDASRLGGRAGDDADAGSPIAVFDRPRVILAIFARRASSPVTKLRIEVAEAQQAKAKLGSSALRGVQGQLKMTADALQRRVPGCRGADLLRSGAGFGVNVSFNSSPQKTRQKQKRKADDSERRISDEVGRLRSHRSTQRRRRNGMWTIGLVGYTNVGKSAIVNRLTGSKLMVRNGVFVTLETAARRVLLPAGQECYVLDSVGFVKDLPIQLCDAFAATVEELQAADLVLHVRDLSHPLYDDHYNVVTSVLKSSGIDTDRRVIEVWNKSDLLSKKVSTHLRYIHSKSYGDGPTFSVSALSGEGFDDLLVGIQDKLESSSAHTVPGLMNAKGAVEVSRRCLHRVYFANGMSSERAADQWDFLREHGKVVDESLVSEDSGVVVDVWMDDSVLAKCQRRFGAHIFL